MKINMVSDNNRLFSSAGNLHKRQRGAVLAVSLIFLLILTLLGISSMKSTLLEEKMAGNMRDQSVAFQSAEAALRLGEGWIASLSTRPDISAVGTTQPVIWDYNAADPVTSNNILWWDEPTRNKTWWDSNGVVISGTDAFIGVNSQAVYAMELMPPHTPSLEAGVDTEDAEYFLRVTARGTGGTDNAIILLQTHYKW
jgi:type IV pilus assembly protein PilX